MAARIVKTLPKTGSVSRRKVRAAVHGVMKSGAWKAKPTKRRVLRKSQTASGSKKIAFRKVGNRTLAA